jgi:hypothetical protein
MKATREAEAMVETEVARMMHTNYATYRRYPTSYPTIIPTIYPTMCQ